MGKDYLIKIPFIIDKNADMLRQGKSSLHALLKNTTGQEEMRKVIELIP
jgi:hypothetical protein